ncbi:MAG: SagB/ThcOx family dehydrogenase [Acidovorax sp.]|uniref:SagB/ThcOx family dehydrogenase n=1 Tax=Acidovorax sp. TaxID=1872122 RepID=UPI0039E662DA
MNDFPEQDEAPLFALFWANSDLNDARAWPLAERIGHDAATPYRPPRPVLPQAARHLPVPQGALCELYAQRRSVRRFGEQPLTPHDLSRLLMPLAQRQPGWPGAVQDAQVPPTRYLASGGAKYPMQCYGIVLKAVDAQGQPLPPQRVWYDPIGHGLTPMGEAPAWPALAAMLGVGDWDSMPASVWLLVAQSEASCRKYGERGGRFVLLEAGSQLGALALQAAEAGLVGTALGSFHDQALLDVFELDTGHQAVAAYACGHPAP